MPLRRRKNPGVQLYGDFRENRISTGFGAVTPQFEGQFAFGNLREVLPEVLSAAMLEGMEHFGHVIHGFDREDAVFAGVREPDLLAAADSALHHATMESSTIAGIYPCGEGAGYAGRHYLGSDGWDEDGRGNYREVCYPQN